MGCGNNCACGGEAVEVSGRWVCHAEKCPHRLAEGGCALGKVSLTCDDNSCRWNHSIAPGVYGCLAMDVHLDAQGRCYAHEEKA